ncbi:hypothetical protein STEG23_023987, partial [Scotinomys teguina]
VNCEVNVDDCASNPCTFGVCHDGINHYDCICQLGFTSGCHRAGRALKDRDCALDVDECLSSPCGPGTCTDHVASFTCTCPPGYRGFHCENDLPDCSPRMSTCHLLHCPGCLHGRWLTALILAARLAVEAWWKSSLPATPDVKAVDELESKIFHKPEVLVFESELFHLP